MKSNSEDIFESVNEVNKIHNTIDSIYLDCYSGYHFVYNFKWREARIAMWTKKNGVVYLCNIKNMDIHTINNYYLRVREFINLPHIIEKLKIIELMQ